MKFGLKRTVPGALLVSVQEVKDQLRIDYDDDDNLIQGYSIVAQDLCEGITGRSFTQSTWQMALDSLPYGYDQITLPRSPLLDNSVSITYTDISTGNILTLAPTEYITDSFSLPARLAPQYQKLWPVTRQVINAVIIQWNAGMDPNDPELAALKHLTRMLIAGWYQYRVPVTSGMTVNELPLPLNFCSLLVPYTIYRFGG